MYKGDLKRLVLGFAGRIQATFTMSDAFDEIKDADSKAEVSNAISELYRDGKLARQKTKLGNSYLYALPAFAPAAFEMYEEPLTEQSESQEQEEPQKSYFEQKIDEIRTAADQEEDKPAESVKTSEFVPETERKETKFESNIGEELKVRYFKSLDEIPDSEIDGVSNVVIESLGEASHLKINLPINSKFTLNAPNGLSITIESAGK